MKFLKSRGGAIAVTVVIIALSVVFGAHRSLNAVRNDVLQTFSVGVDGSGHSIQADLNACHATAANLTVVAGRYLTERDPLLLALSSALAEAQTAGEENSLAGQRVAYQRMTQKADFLIQALADEALSEKDAQYVKGFQAELKARAFSIAQDGYNDLAEAFNRSVLGTFPANLLKHVAVVDELTTFR